MSEGFGRYNLRIVSSYHPRLCGIGIYSENYITGTTRFTSETSAIRVAAIDRKEGKAHNEYHFPVDVIIKQDEESSWRDAARDIAQRSIEMSYGERIPTVVIINHEFGLGGKFWDRDNNYSSFLNSLRDTDAYKRGLLYIITTLHTILPRPSEHIRQVTCDLVQKSDSTIVLSALGKDILKEVYSLDADRFMIEHIDHGVRMNSYDLDECISIKEGWGVDIDTFTFVLPGLISPGKGIFDYSVPAYTAAVKELTRRGSKARTRMIITGGVHPGFQNSEQYPGFLRTSRDALRSSGLLLNKQDPFSDPVSLNQIRRARRKHGIMFSCIPLTESQYSQTFAGGDAPLFAYKGMSQISSGQISESMGHGRAPIATKFWHAFEMLAPDHSQSLEDVLAGKIPYKGQIIGKGDEHARGLLVDCDSGEETIQQLKEAIVYCVTHPKEHWRRSENAKQKGEEMTWDRTYAKNLALIEKLKKRRKK
jgi:polysaccharide biosynthesis protein PslF